MFPFESRFWRGSPIPRFAVPRYLLKDWKSRKNWNTRTKPFVEVRRVSDVGRGADGTSAAAVTAMESFLWPGTRELGSQSTRVWRILNYVPLA